MQEVLNAARQLASDSMIVSPAAVNKSESHLYVHVCVCVCFQLTINSFSISITELCLQLDIRFSKRVCGQLHVHCSTKLGTFMYSLISIAMQHNLHIKLVSATFRQSFFIHAHIVVVCTYVYVYTLSDAGPQYPV